LRDYLIKRVIYSLLTLIVLVSFTFFLMRLMPGDPFIGQKAIPESVHQELMKKYDLDKPMIVQYFRYLYNVFLQGDLGDSLFYRGRPVTSVIAQTFPVSAELGIRSLVIAVVMGLTLGVLAAVKREKLTDTLVMIIAVFGVSVPGFIVGGLLNYFVGVKFSGLVKDVFDISYNIIPVAGWKTEAHKILPVFALCLGSLAQISRLMRANMIDVMSSDYIKTAKAKGLSPSAVVFRHGLRNGILPVVTILGPLAAALLTGTFVIEQIFSVPGMGKYFVSSVQTLDYTVISGMTMFYGAFLIILNMVVDIAYGFIDPRIRLEK
jgi:oligopeptide transport system permease protein